MWKKHTLVLLYSLLFHPGFSQFITHTNTDPRLVSNGSEIPSCIYADQPYIIVCDDGSWLAVMTTSAGTEYAYMNHIISTKSYDQGESWTRPVEVEPPAPPQSAWAVPLKVPGGRIYVFYNYNRDGFTGVEGVMSGPFMFKYSDDHGLSWSDQRYEAPIRRTIIDKQNYTGGKTYFFWSIDKPVVTDQAAYITFSKIFREIPKQPEFYRRSEGFILRSENILSESRPEKIRWTTLPEGESGIMNPEFGPVQAEHNSVIMNNGILYVVYRTIDGFPAFATSSDGGKTFSSPAPMTYASGGIMGNPRACPKIHKTREGKYLFWYHNNFRKNSYNGRNPVWLSGGIEKEGRILWSQPEIILYDEDTQLLGMSYPDFIEQNGQLWISETQKNKARIHKMDSDLIRGLWNQFTLAEVSRKGLVLESDARMLATGRINFPPLSSLARGGGFSLELWLEANSLEGGQEILSTLGTTHKGIRVLLSEEKSIGIQLNDGELRENKLKGQTFYSDPGTLEAGQRHHVVFIVDGAAKIVSVIVDGVLSDGDLDLSPYGWGRLYPHLGELNGSPVCDLNLGFDGKIHHIRLYNRYLTSSEAIANYRAGMGK